MTPDCQHEICTQYNIYLLAIIPDNHANVNRLIRLFR